MNKDRLKEDGPHIGVVGLIPPGDRNNFMPVRELVGREEKSVYGAAANYLIALIEAGTEMDEACVLVNVGLCAVSVHCRIRTFGDTGW